MWSRKELKKSAKRSLKLNYIACVAVCFIMMFIAGEYQSTVQFILQYDMHNVANLKYDTDQKLEIVREIEEICGGKGKLETSSSEQIDKAVDEVSDKYKIFDRRTVRSWVDIYLDKGPSGLNYREVTMFGTTGDTSNWQAVKRTLETFVTDEISLENDMGVTEEEVAYFFDLATKEDSSKIGVINYVIRLFSQEVTWRIFISLGSSLLGLIVAIFIAGPLIVGEKRFFMETRTYHKTRIGRLGFLFKERCYKPIWTMLTVDVFQFLWGLTIIGGVIKMYEYEMIPFILAENPQIERKKAFKLSKQMMRGNKWRSFIIDLSFAPWLIAVFGAAALIGLLFFGMSFDTSIVTQVVGALFMTFFLNPYKTATKTEMYMALRKNAILNGYKYSEELNDKYIDLELLEQMSAEE